MIRAIGAHRGHQDRECPVPGETTHDKSRSNPALPVPRSHESPLMRDPARTRQGSGLHRRVSQILPQLVCARRVRLWPGSLRSMTHHQDVPR